MSKTAYDLRFKPGLPFREIRVMDIPDHAIADVTSEGDIRFTWQDKNTYWDWIEDGKKG